jgi:hypothetical protein
VRSFAIDANHLLLPCDDPGFHDGLKRRVILQSLQANPVFFEKRSQFLGLGIFSDQAHHKYRRRKLSDISCDVGGASGIVGFPDHFHHWDRRLRRNPGNSPPNELIEHEITDYQDAFTRKSPQEFFDAIELHYLSSHIRKLRLLKEKFPFRIDRLVILKIKKVGL